MDPSAAADVAELATDGFTLLSPQVLIVGGAGIGLVVLTVVYAMVARAIKSRGKSVG